MPATVRIVDANNNASEIPIDQAGELLARGGYRLETGADVAKRAQAEAEADVYGGAAGKVVATGAAVARGLSGGGSDALIAGLGGGRQLRKLREQNEELSLAGELVGSVVPIGAPGLAARIGERAASGLAKGSGLAHAFAKNAIEGGIQGIGSGISEVSLSEDPLTMEGFVSSLSSNALFGAGIGGAAGTVGKAAELGLQKARNGLQSISQRVASGADSDLARLGTKELDTLADEEVTRLVTEQRAVRASTVDDVAAYRQQIRDANPFLVVDEKASGLLGSSTQSIERALSVPKKLADNPYAKLGEPLEKQEQALVSAIERRDELLARFEKQSQKIAGEVGDQLGKLAPDATEIELTGDAMKRYAAFADVKTSKKTKSLKVDRADAEAFATAIENGAVKTSAEKALGQLDQLLESNRNLQAKINAGRVPKAELVSDRLAAIRAAKDAAVEAANRPRGFVEDMAQGSIFGHAAGLLSGVPVLGPLVGAKVARAATDLVFGRLGKAASETSRRAAAGVDAFLGGAQKALRPVPVLATRTLSRVRYAQQEAREAEAESAESEKSLAKLYKRRSAEIRGQTMYGSDGKAMMRPEARQALSAQLAGVKAADPIAADRMETIAARRMEFLANKLPRRPDIGGIPMGPDNWQPSELQMRQFARYAAAVEDPAGVVERLAAGTITPEDAEAMRTVYPETMAAIKARIIERLPELTKTLPYNRKLALSIFSGVPVDPAMRPEILAVLQGQFEEEPGTEGGTQAPPPAPQFGSISKENATPAQERTG